MLKYSSVPTVALSSAMQKSNRDLIFIKNNIQRKAVLLQARIKLNKMNASQVISVRTCTGGVTKLGYCLSFFLRYKCATKNQISLKTKIGNALKPDTSEIHCEVRSRVELLYMVLQTTT